MKTHRTQVVTALLPLTLLLLSTSAMAQQQPVTGQMMAGQQAVIAAATPAPATAPAPAYAPMTSVDASHAAPSTYAEASTMPLQQHATMAAPIEYAAPVATPPAHRDAWVAYAEDAPARYTSSVGETTRDLLQRQAKGRVAGKSLPMLGAEASTSYQRYLNSFNHPIPEFFKTMVDKNSQGGR